MSQLGQTSSLTLSDSGAVASADIVSILANNGSGTVAVSSATSFTGTAALTLRQLRRAVMSQLGQTSTRR